LAGHAVRIGAKRNARRILVGKPEGHEGNHTQGSCLFTARRISATQQPHLGYAQQVRTGTDEASQWRDAGKVSYPLLN
jgi:hypothetical protein